jgi:L-sorbose 1-phosphate reductase
MSFDEFQKYQQADCLIPEKQYTWPLYGAGLESLGKEGDPVIRDLRDVGDDEILMRIDAVSLCYTDLKEISLGDNHPRLKERDLKNNPIIPGHELSMTVVKVGQNLKDKYKLGQRFTLQPDVWVDGKSVPFSFGMDGAYRQYAIIDHKILKGDAGNYLIPVPNDMTYAAAAITEPWACVEAAYRMVYRTHFQTGGSVLILGKQDSRVGYTIDAEWLEKAKPAKIHVCDIPKDLEEKIEKLCKALLIEFAVKSYDEVHGGGKFYTDLVLLDGAVSECELLGKNLAKKSITAFILNSFDSDSVEIDLGRLHYDDFQYVGTDKLEISEAYTKTPPRVELKHNGTAWILGGGGPMGRMHLQRAIETPFGPRMIIVTEVSDVRLDSLREFFGPLADKYNKKLVLLNPVEDETGYHSTMNDILDDGGVDDIEVMVTIPIIIEDACQYLAPKGVVNIFAGVKRGVGLDIDPMLIAGDRQVRFIGHSGSALDDQQAVVDRCLSNELNTNLSVAAIGGLNQIPEGIQAMKDSIFPGKIVIYPQFMDIPLTGLSSLDEVLPNVAAALGENNTWTQAAENALFEDQLQ